MTLVQFIVNFLRPYKDLPEFAVCIIKALQELGYPVSYTRDGYVVSYPTGKSCKLEGKEIDCIIIDESACDE